MGLQIKVVGGLYALVLLRPTEKQRHKDDPENVNNSTHNWYGSEADLGQTDKTLKY